MKIGAVLLTVFVVLKLTHLIDWNWIWVLSPVWVPLIIVMILSALIAVYRREWLK